MSSAISIVSFVAVAGAPAALLTLPQEGRPAALVARSPHDALAAAAAIGGIIDIRDGGRVVIVAQYPEHAPRGVVALSASDRLACGEAANAENPQ